jgi:hypothetical protein
VLGFGARRMRLGRCISQPSFQYGVRSTRLRRRFGCCGRFSGFGCNGRALEGTANELAVAHAGRCRVSRAPCYREAV